MSSGKLRPNSKGSLRKKHTDKTPLLNKNVEVQNARVYVFGDDDIVENELEDNKLELRPRGRALKHQKELETTTESEEPEYLERPISDGETLHSIALRFGVQVAELKRINNLIRDQDFFGLTVIKLPLKRHGLLSELVEQENAENSTGAKLTLHTNGFEYYSEANETENSDENEELLVRTLSIRDSVKSGQGKEAASFLQRMDKDLKSIVNSTKNQKDSLEEVVQSMTCKRIYPLQRQSSWLNGYDCGMRWWSLLLTFIIVGFIGPLIYFVYLEVQKKRGS